jgi:hypothetical protein
MAARWLPRTRRWSLDVNRRLLCLVVAVAVSVDVGCCPSGSVPTAIPRAPRHRPPCQRCRGVHGHGPWSMVHGGWWAGGDRGRTHTAAKCAWSGSASKREPSRWAESANRPYLIKAHVCESEGELRALRHRCFFVTVHGLALHGLVSSQPAVSQSVSQSVIHHHVSPASQRILRRCINSIRRNGSTTAVAASLTHAQPTTNLHPSPHPHPHPHPVTYRTYQPPYPPLHISPFGPRNLKIHPPAPCPSGTSRLSSLARLSEACEIRCSHDN